MELNVTHKSKKKEAIKENGIFKNLELSAMDVGKLIISKETVDNDNRNNVYKE